MVYAGDDAEVVAWFALLQSLDLKCAASADT